MPGERWALGPACLSAALTPLPKAPPRRAPAARLGPVPLAVGIVPGLARWVISTPAGLYQCPIRPGGWREVRRYGGSTDGLVLLNAATSARVLALLGYGAPEGTG